MTITTVATANLRHAATPTWAAASTALAPLLTGPRRPLRVASSTRHALGLVVDPVGDAAGAPELISICGPHAVRLPCAMVLAVPVPPTGPDDAGVVGAGRLDLPAVTFRVGRWWSPPRPTLRHVDRAAGRVAAAVAIDEVDHTVRAAGRRLGTALAGEPADLAAAVHGLLGLGPGLTPAGDDVLAGALVALRAAGDARADQLCDAVRAARPFHRTTAVSAGLLTHAARGECVPELAAFLVALDDDEADLDAARAELFTVGHTSGAALQFGVALALGPSPATPTSSRMDHL